MSSVLGCLVNISSCKDLLVVSNAMQIIIKLPVQYLPWQTLLGSDHLQSLVDVVVSYLDGCQEQKILELGLMLLDNLMRTNLQFKVRKCLPGLAGVNSYLQVQETLLSSEAKKSLTGLLIRLSVGERARPSLVKVAARLQGILDLQGLQELEP